MSSERGCVPTSELANAFVAAHDKSLISSNPEAWGKERAINNLQAIDAGVEAVRARLTAAQPSREDIREAISDALGTDASKRTYGVDREMIDCVTSAVMAVLEQGQGGE
ncbi:MAG: hypothetical protein IT477_10760 [Rhodanobacteraceae bacterium]|nr:hypothetical protein [Rhodanobacteraceae bacterium]